MPIKKTIDKESKEAFDLMARCLAVLREGKPARTADISADDIARFGYRFDPF